MQTLKILIGILTILLAWIYVYRSKVIFNINAWMRENVFSDRLTLFSGRRVAALLLVLGGVALFSGIEGIVELQPIKPNVAHQMLEQARLDFKKGAYPQVVNRCKELVRSDPKNTEAWELLANAWWAMGRKNMAMEALSSLKRVDANYSLKQSALGKVLEEKAGASK